MVLLFLSLAIWTSNSATVEAFNCSGGYHKHVDDDGNKRCHKHCHNGMNDHNRDHGDNCAVNNRPSQPRRRSSNDDDDRGSSPAPRPSGRSGVIAPTATPAKPPHTLACYAADWHIHLNSRGFAETACHLDTVCHAPHCILTPTPTPAPTATPTATATPYVVDTLNPVEFGVGNAACDVTDSIFDPDPLDTAVVPVDGWVDSSTANSLLALTTCPLTGAWLRASDFITGWSVDPQRPVMDTQGGTDWVRIKVPAANLRDALKITCTDGDPPQQQAVSVQGVAVKATHTTNAQSFVQGWLDLMFRGSTIRGHSPYCLAKAYTPGANLEFEWLQSGGDIVDPGDYDLELRVCVAEQIGSQRACQQVKSAGTTSEPGILIRALTTSGVED